MKNKIRLILISVIGIGLIISIICIKYNLKTIFNCIPPYKFVSRWNCKVAWGFVIPQCLTVDSKGYIYVAYACDCIAKFNPDGKMIAKWAKWQKEWELPGQFENIWDICVDSHDYIYVTYTNRIQKIDNNGNFVCVVCERKKGFYKPAFDINGNMFLIKGRNTVEKFDCKGNFITKWGVVEYPFDIKIDSKGDIYVASSVKKSEVESAEIEEVSEDVVGYHGNIHKKIITYDSYISKFDSLGKVLHKNLYMKKNSKNVSMEGIVIDSRGNFFILEGFSILMYDNKGDFIGKFGSYGFRNGCFEYPVDIEIDKENNIYLLDAITHCIQKFSPK